MNFVTSHLSWSLLEWCWNNVVWILDFIFKFCLYKLLHHTFKDLLRNLAKCCIKKDVPLVEFTYLVFTHMPSESYGRWLRSVIKGSTVFWWKFWFWLWFHSLAYQFAATRTECCITTGLCFLTESAFSLHSFLPPPSLPFLLLSLPWPPPLHPVITQSSSRCPPCFCTPSPPLATAGHSHCSLTLSSFPSSKLHVMEVCHKGFYCVLVESIRLFYVTVNLSNMYNIVQGNSFSIREPVWPSSKAVGW